MARGPVIPTWALVPMWGATVVGAYFLSLDVLARLRR